MGSKRCSIVLIILILIISSLACGLLGGSDEPTESVVPADQSTENTAPQSLADESSSVESEAPQSAPDVKLGDEYRSEEGGYAFQPVPDYAFEEFFGLASMTAPDADPERGPMLVLIGGTNEEEATQDELFNQFMQDAEGEDIQILDQREIMVDGKSGILAEISGSDVNGLPITGRIVVVAVTPTQQFTLFASAPEDRWGEIAAKFDAVLASVTFFEPKEIDLSEGLGEDISGGEVQDLSPLGQDETIRQWASFAYASSEYGSDDWSAMQATSEPDSTLCGDQTTAWASSSSNTVEWLELSYNVAVIPTEINIYEVYYPDQVVKVEVADENMDYYTVYESTPTDHAGGDCPYILNIPVNIDQPVYSVKITVDQSVLTSWNEIDAVELVGTTSQGGLPAVPNPDFSAMGEFPTAYSDLPAGGFAYLLASNDGSLPVIVNQGTLQDQSTSAEYVLGLVSEDEQNVLTIFLPLNVAAGVQIMLPYDDNSPTKSPGATVYKGLTLYTNTDGIIMVEEIQNDTISGMVAFTALDESGNQLSVTGFFNQLPLAVP